MTESKTINDLFDMLARVLLRSFLLGYGLLLLWSMMYLFGSTLIYGPARLFGLTPHEVDVIHYCALAGVKSVLLLFFFFPYVAIRLTLRKSP